MESDLARVAAVFSNRADAYALERANRMNIPTVVFDRTEFYDDDTVLERLAAMLPDLIVLAGFLWKVPEKIVRAFPNRIVNIHPALLPKYGGKGMYGIRVHRAVVENGESESGITIHYVNEHYDEGAIIFQAKCAIDEHDTAETLAEKIHELEHKHFPATIERVLRLV